MSELNQVRIYKVPVSAILAYLRAQGLPDDGALVGSPMLSGDHLKFLVKSRHYFRPTQGPSEC